MKKNGQFPDEFVRIKGTQIHYVTWRIVIVISAIFSNLIITSGRDQRRWAGAGWHITGGSYFELVNSYSTVPQRIICTLEYLNVLSSRMN